VNFSAGWFFLGDTYAAVLLLVYMPHYTPAFAHNWRTLVLCATVPSAIMLPFTFLCLQESPHFLLIKGLRKEAASTVKCIAITNGNERALRHIPETEDAEETAGLSQDTEASPPEEQRSRHAPTTSPPPRDDACVGDSEGEEAQQTFQEGLRMVWDSELRGILFGGAYLCFVGNFLFYGLTYALPQVLFAARGVAAPAWQILRASLSSFPGVLLVGLLLRSKTFGHRDGLAALAGALALLQGGLMCVDRGPAWIEVAFSATYLTKCTISAFFFLVYIYLGEVFPSACRCTALSCCMAAGRLGSIAAPMAFEMLSGTAKDGSIHKHTAYFSLNATFCVLAIVAIRHLLCFELKNSPLEERLESVSVSRRESAPGRLQLHGRRSSTFAPPGDKRSAGDEGAFRRRSDLGPQKLAGFSA
jgi:hypothetical protein